MDEKSVVANIQELVRRLNGEFKAARELGLKAHIEDNPRFAREGERIWIRIWREIELLEEPRFNNPLASVYTATPQVLYDQSMVKKG